MYCLSDKQIDYIINDISTRGVEMEALQQNLLDHICCIVEQNLEVDGDFESFYQKTIKTFYKDALWEIEEETLLLLTFKNYYKMKKTMIISGLFSAITMTVGLIFKFMHWPGASPMILMGVASLGLIFLPLMSVLKTKEKQNKNDKLIIVFGAVFGVLISFAVLFKIFHWPGANIMGLISVAIMLLVFTPLYYFTGIRNPENKTNTIMITILLVMGCGLFLTLINSRPGFTIVKTSEKINQHLEECYNYATQQNSLIFNKTIIDTLTNKKNNIELNKKCNELCNAIEVIKLNVLQLTEQNIATVITYSELTMPDNYDIPTNILFGENATAKPQLQALKTNLNNFNTFILENFKQNSAILINLSDITNTDSGLPETWEKSNYYHMPLVCILRNLTQLQLEVRLIESNCMR